MTCIKNCGLLILALGYLVACQAHASGGQSELRSGDNYKVLAATKVLPDKALAGELELLIIKKGKDWKLTTDAPMRITVTVPDGVELTKKLWKNADAAKLEKNKQARFVLPYKLKAAGSYDLKLKFSFVLCTETLCQKKRFEVDYTLKGG